MLGFGYGHLKSPSSARSRGPLAGPRSYTFFEVWQSGCSHRHTAGGDREARVSRRPGPQRQGDARVPVPSPGFLGRTRRAEPLGSRELEQRRKHLHSAREKGDPLRRAAGTGGCLPQPLGRCGEITSRPCRGIRQPPGPASPRRGKTLASVLIAPCWIQEVLWIVQQAYCH